VVLTVHLAHIGGVVRCVLFPAGWVTGEEATASWSSRWVGYTRRLTCASDKWKTNPSGQRSYLSYGVQSSKNSNERWCTLFAI